MTLFTMALMLFLGIQGCTTVVAAAGYPTASTAPQTSYHTLTLVYKSTDKPIEVIHKWHCTYEKIFSTNDGWSIRANSSSNAAIRMLGPDKYLYVLVPACNKEGDYVPPIVEVKHPAAVPEATLISSGFYGSCKSDKYSDNIISSRVTVTNIPSIDTVLSDEESLVFEQINSFTYSALPIHVVNEKELNAYPELAKNLSMLRDTTSATDYYARFRPGTPTSKRFPVPLPDSSDKNIVFAKYVDQKWIFIEGEKSVNFRPHKKGTADQLNHVVSFKGKNLTDWDAVYDPQSRSIYQWSFEQKCF